MSETTSDEAFSEQTASPASTTLAEALARLSLELPAEQVAQLERYARLLWDWNEKINLTRHTDFDRFAARDVVDAVELAKLLEPGERVLDVGTGGGVPGIPLAILRPDVQISLCDSVGKKARAVEDIVRQIGLETPVYHLAAQNHLGEDWYDTLAIRAVARLAKLLGWFKGHWGQFGRLLVIKGPAWVEERGEARHRNLLHDLELRRRASYPLQGSESESVILELRPKPEA